MKSLCSPCKKPRPPFLAPFLFLVATASFLFPSCDSPKKDNPPREETVAGPETPVTPPEAGPEALKTGFDATLVYTEGLVEALEGETWSPVDVGAHLLAGQSIRTGVASLCEVQFAGQSALKLFASSQVAIETMVAREGGRGVGLRLVAGKVFSKVKKLAAGDSFMFSTPNSICGVRGTEFSLSLEKGRGTVIAVKEGRVAVLPASPVLNGLIASSGKDLLARSVVAAIVAMAPVVSASQEMAVDEKGQARAEIAYEAVRAEIAALPPEALVEAPVIQEGALVITPEPPAPIVLPEASQAGADAAIARYKAAFEPASPKTVPLSAPKSQEMKEAADTMKPLPPEGEGGGGSLPPESALPLPEAPRAAAAPPPVAPKAIAPPPVSKPVAVTTPGKQPVTPLPVNPIQETGPAKPRDTETPEPRESLPERPAAVVAPPPPAAPPPAAPPAPPPAPARKDPVLGRFAVTGKRVAGSVVQLEGTILVADQAGTVSAVDAQGKRLWQVASANGNNENSYPVFYKGTVYFSGSSELVVMSGGDGSVLARQGLDASRAHVFGSRVAPFPNALLFPTLAGVDVIDPASGAVQRSIAVPEGANMTPANYGGKIAIVGQKGMFMLLDPDTGETLAQVKTGALQPVALAPRIYKDMACFADRKGTVVLIDLKAMRVLWERKIGDGVFTDPEMNEAGVFVYAKNALYGFGLDGESLFAPVKDLSAPPLLSNGKLYYCLKSGDLVIASASPYRVEKTFALGDTITARPLMVGGVLWLGTIKGGLIKLDPGLIE